MVPAIHIANLQQVKLTYLRRVLGYRRDLGMRLSAQHLEPTAKMRS